MNLTDRIHGTRTPLGRLRTRILLTASGLVVLALGAAALAILRTFIRPPAPRVGTDRIRVAAIGDSNTFGLGVVLHHRSRNSYPAQLQSLLGNRFQVLNYGLNSRTLLASGDRPYEKNRFFRSSQEARPEVVLIMLGTNDAKIKNWDAAEYEQQLEAFAVRYRGLTSSPAVYLLTPPAAFQNSVGIQPEVIAGEIRPIIERVGRKLDLPVIDAYAATAGSSELFPDGIHPNTRGYQLIAEAVHVQLAARQR